MAHLSLNASLIALFKVKYRKSATIRKTFKISLKLDQAQYCMSFCFKLTTKYETKGETIVRQNFLRFSLY